jgi:hypothetical protein
VAALLAAAVQAAPGAGRALAFPAAPVDSGRDPRSVVALTVTYQGWDADRPWARTRPAVRQASAVVVEGPWLLTTAQMVADATFIQADKFGRSTRSHPRVQFVDREVDLALLAVDDPGFFADLRPAPLASRTPVEGTLRSVRWREQQLEAAASRVKRVLIETSSYGRLEHPFLWVQTDLDGGGWAEPVFTDGKLVGLTVSQSEQRARVIPVEILARFLERARDPGTYPAFPVLGAMWQVNTDPALAAWLGQREDPRGVLIRQIPWGSSGCGVLKSWDILLSIDGRPIDAEGFFTHPHFGQLRFPAIYVMDRVAGDTVPLQVLRQGRVIDLEMTLRASPIEQDLVPARAAAAPPAYLIAGGLIFIELDVDYLRTWGRDWPSKAPLRLIGRYHLDQLAQRPARRRIVLLKSVLPSEYNIGYQDLEDQVVEAINGLPIDSIADVDEALRRPEGEFQRIVLSPDSVRREIILDAAGLEEATAGILEDYRIPAAVRLPAPLATDPPVDCPGDF